MLNDEPRLSAWQSRLVGNSAWALFGKVITGLSAFAVNALLLKLLTPQDAGVYFLAVSLLGIATTISMLGQKEVTVRQVAEACSEARLEDARTSLKTSATLCLTAGSLVASLIFSRMGREMATEFFGSEELVRVMPFIALLIPVILLRDLLAEAFRGMNNIRLATLLGEGSTTVALAVVLGTFALLRRSIDVGDALISLLGCAAVILLLSALAAKGSLPRASSSKWPVSENLGVGLPLALVAIASYAMVEAGTALLGATSPERSVALYGAAIRLTGLLTMPLLIVNATIPALVVHLRKSHNPEALQLLLRSSATASLIVTLLGALPLMSATEPLLKHIYGPYYAHAAVVVRIVSAGQIFNVAMGSPGLVLALVGHQREVLWAAISSTTLVIILGTKLVPDLGPVGAGIALTSGLVVQNSILVLAVWRRLSILPLAYMNPLRWRACLQFALSRTSAS